MLMLMAKLCAIHFDTTTENKLVFRLHMALLLWSVAHMVKATSMFLVNPDDLYE